MLIRIIALMALGALTPFSEVSAQEPPTVTDMTFLNVSPSEILTHTFETFRGDAPITWDSFAFVDYRPAYGGTGSGPFYPATFDPDTQYFRWDSSGSPLGVYEWQVRASNQYGSDQGRLIVDMSIPPEVPEPDNLVLVGMATIGLLGKKHRRS